MTVHADVIVCCMILTENQLLVYRSRRHRYHSCRRVTDVRAGRSSSNNYRCVERGFDFPAAGRVLVVVKMAVTKAREKLLVGRNMDL